MVVGKKKTIDSIVSGSQLVDKIVLKTELREPTKTSTTKNKKENKTKKKPKRRLRKTTLLCQATDPQKT